MNSISVKKSDFKINLPELLQSVEVVLQKYPLNEKNRQICFTSYKTTDQSVYDGIGTIYDREKLDWKVQEKDFRFFLNEFRGTYLETVYNDLQKFSDGKIARMRLMYLPPVSCYSFHFDITQRYHISLITNESAFLIFKNEIPAHIPADGYVYHVDTRNDHTAVNSGGLPRIHLVFSLANDSDDDRIFDERINVLKNKT